MACKYRVAGRSKLPHSQGPSLECASLLAELVLETLETVSGEQFLHDVAVHVGQAEIAALEAVGQLRCDRSPAGAGSSRAGRGRGRGPSTTLKPSSSVSPSVMPGLMPPPASHMVKALG